MKVLETSAPDLGGALIGELSQALAAGSQADLDFPWTPTSLGAHRLFAVADTADVVDESDEGDNQTWLDMYVGFAGPLLLDSGTLSEPAYTPTLGYGYLDEGQADVLATCGAGTSPEETLRRDPQGTVVYQYDHLLPGHFYHLDVTLFECDGAGGHASNQTGTGTLRTIP